MPNIPIPEHVRRTRWIDLSEGQSAEALRVRIRSRVRLDLLWSTGADCEQLAFDLLEARE